MNIYRTIIIPRRNLYNIFLLLTTNIIKKTTTKAKKLAAEEAKTKAIPRITTL